MSVLVSEIISDFNAQMLDYKQDPTVIATSRLIRLINKCQREFAVRGLAFDDIVYINTVAEQSTYDLPDTFLTAYGSPEYDSGRIIPLPHGVPAPSSVKYYRTYDNKIQLIDAPSESGDEKLKVYFYRLPSITISVTTDEVELVNKHLELQDAVVDFLLYEILASKPEFNNVTSYHWSKFNTAIDMCKSKQRKKVLQNTMHLGA